MSKRLGERVAVAAERSRLDSREQSFPWLLSSFQIRMGRAGSVDLASSPRLRGLEPFKIGGRHPVLDVALEPVLLDPAQMNERFFPSSLHGAQRPNVSVSF